MQIQATNLQFKAGLKLRRLTVREILHHSDSETGDAYRFHKQHLNQGWAGLGYHFVILVDGTIQRGRPENMIGSHAGPNGNGDSLGINFVGDFTDHGPTEAQIQSYLWLHKRNEQIYGPLAVMGHGDVMPTACPGAMFPMTRIKQLIAGGGQEDMKIGLELPEVKVELAGAAKPKCVIINVDGKDTTYIPAVILRDIGKTVTWDPATGTVKID